MMKGSKSYSNRPMFRGNNGGNDGKIPTGKKKKNAQKPQQNKYLNGVCIDSMHAANEKSTGANSEALDSDVPMMLPDNMKEQQEQVTVTSGCEEISKEVKAVIKEIKHVRRRIRNMQESIQLSVNIAQPKVWEDNSLNAVLNCVNEWRNIVSYHGISRQTTTLNSDDDISTSDGLNENEEKQPNVENNENVVPSSNILQTHDAQDEESYPLHPQNEWSKETALQIFNLIQMAMQTGPLKGRDAGYFKRCGADVAKMARNFLSSCINPYPSSDSDNSTERLVLELRFSVKQKEKIEKWIQNADKTIVANKSPSKSALKLQKSINTKGMSRKDKRRKGRLIK